jgi:hypothetical protein
LTAYSTIEKAAVVFLNDNRWSGAVDLSTIETYEFSVNSGVNPERAKLLLTDRTVLRCHRIRRHFREVTLLSAAREARRGLPEAVANANPAGTPHRLPTFAATAVRRQLAESSRYRAAQLSRRRRANRAAAATSNGWFYSSLARD